MGKKNMFVRKSNHNKSLEEIKFDHIFSEQNNSNIQRNSFDYLDNESNSIKYNNAADFINDELYPSNTGNKYSFINNDIFRFNNDKQEFKIIDNCSHSNKEIYPKSGKQKLSKNNDNKEKLFFCQVCNISFTRRSHLKKHCFFKHSGYTGTVCCYCGKNIIRIKDHIRYCRLKYNNKKINERKVITRKFSSRDKKIINKTKKNDSSIKEHINTFYDIYLNPKNGNNINFTDFKIYLNYNLGQGGNMSAFYGRDNIYGTDLAIKMELKKKVKSNIINENIILSLLKGIKGVPSFYYYEYYKGQNIIAETLLGFNLGSIRKSTNFEFDWIFIPLLGINLVKILKDIHSKGVIHNDIKPSNICWGKFSNGNITDLDQFYIVDFGYSKIYSNLLFTKEKNNSLKNLKYATLNIITDSYTGTPKFMAIDKSKGLHPSRKTDLEEMIYTLLYLRFKTLPWEKIKTKNHTEKCKKMSLIKEKILENGYFDDINPEIKYVYKNIRKLELNEEPDYELYIILFDSILKKLNFDYEKSKSLYLQKTMGKIFNIEDSRIKLENASEIINQIFNGLSIEFTFRKKRK